MKNDELEYTVLAYLIEYAARSREIIRCAAISPEMFEDDKCRAAFIALMDEETDDRDVLAYKASKPSGIKCPPFMGDRSGRDTCKFSLTL